MDLSARALVVVVEARDVRLNPVHGRGVEGWGRGGNPHDVWIQLAPGDLGGDPRGWLVIRLPREHEGAPVDAEEAGGSEVRPRLQRLLWGDVPGAGDLARRVGADGQSGEVEGPERIADFLEVLVVAGIAREVEALRAQHCPGGPEAAPLIGQRQTPA